MQSSIDTRKRALIVGAGIAGPVLAMYLQRAGLEPLIYEGRPAPSDDAGFFMNLAPNGADVLRTLGVEGEALGDGYPTTRIVFENHRGKVLAENPETTTLGSAASLRAGCARPPVGVG